MTKHKLAIIALIIANIIWGAASPIFKLSLQNITPFTLAFIRFFGAAILILPFAYNHLSFDKKDLKYLLILSLSGVSVNIIFFFLGIQRAPSINAPIIASSGPVFIMLGGIFFLKEKIKLKMILGMLLSLLGVMVIIGKPLLENHNTEPAVMGNIFLVIATLGSVIHAISSKEIMHKYKAITVTFWSFLIASCTFFPLFVYESFQPAWMTNIDYRGVLGIVFGIVFSSAIAYLLYQWGLKETEVQEVGLFAYIDPVAALLLAIPLLGEYPTPLFFVGSILIFGGLFISEGRIHWHPIHKLKHKS